MTAEEIIKKAVESAKELNMIPDSFALGVLEVMYNKLLNKHNQLLEMFEKLKSDNNINL